MPIKIIGLQQLAGEVIGDSKVFIRKLITARITDGLRGMSISVQLPDSWISRDWDRSG
jgi:hypothetical protein